ncbi:MAG: hypothetical protein M3Y50_08705 [Acidobacteriota bacterium]|nr:hypothetical protein [Acidobacteriota bacterium]
MALLNFWKNSKEDVLSLKIDQVVSNAGDGNVRDASICATELREYFSQCPADRLFGYAQQCLEKSFTNSGLVLQDIVNGLGRRLDFDVENGLYRGKPGAIGFDGIWRAKGEPDLIIEVKTTDYVTIDLDTHAGYKERLLTAERTTKDASTLIVVGREDTGAIEAQIRGSRYAWDMRLISVESLIRLVKIREKSDDATTMKQIRQLLQPFEYTKIDRIINVIFTTTQDVESHQELESASEIEVVERVVNRQARTNLEELNAKRQQTVAAFSDLKDQPLIRRSITLFSSPDKKFRVCCAVSKRYQDDYQPYWYAYHPAWNEFLAGGDDSYFLLSCMDREEAFAIPFHWLRDNCRNLNTTERGEKSYWHIPITLLPGGLLAINTSRIGAKTSLDGYCFSLRSHKSKTL